MEPHDDEPDDVKRATSVEREIKRGTKDDTFEGYPRVAKKREKWRHCAKPWLKRSRIHKSSKDDADCCQTRRDQIDARRTRYTSVMVYNKPCIIPRQKVVPRHCLTKEEHIDLLATPPRRCPPDCVTKTEKRRIKPITARLRELAAPLKRKLMITLQEDAVKLPPELVDNLIKTVEGEACLTPEQAAQVLRSKKRGKQKKRPPYKAESSKGISKVSLKIKRKLGPVSVTSSLDRDAVNCQFSMAERFVKSILEWRCPIPREEFQDISEVILKRLSYLLEYTPLENEDRKSQQMRFLSDLVACWISGVLFEVSESHRHEIQEECEKKKIEMEEEEEEEEKYEDDDMDDDLDTDDSDDFDDDDDDRADYKRKRKDRKADDDDDDDGRDVAGGRKRGERSRKEAGRGGKGGGGKEETDQIEGSYKEVKMQKSMGEAASRDKLKKETEDKYIQSTMQVTRKDEKAIETARERKDEKGAQIELIKPQDIKKEVETQREIETFAQETQVGSKGSLVKKESAKDEYEEMAKKESGPVAKTYTSEAFLFSSGDTVGVTRDDGVTMVSVKPPSLASFKREDVGEEADGPAVLVIPSIFSLSQEGDGVESGEMKFDVKGEMSKVTFSDYEKAQLMPGGEPHLSQQFGKDGLDYKAASTTDYSKRPRVSDYGEPFAGGCVQCPLERCDTLVEVPCALPCCVMPAVQTGDCCSSRCPHLSKFPCCAPQKGVLTCKPEPITCQCVSGSLSEEENAQVEMMKNWIRNLEEDLRGKSLSTSGKVCDIADLFKTDLPFVTFGKILHVIYSMLETIPENEGSDPIINRIHRAVFEKFITLVECESSKLLTENFEDLIDVVCGKIATWLKSVLTDSQSLFMERNPAEVDPQEVRDWSKWLTCVSESANDWSSWLKKVLKEAKNMQQEIDEDKWKNWTKAVDNDALSWRRFHLATIHKAHHNITMLMGRDIIS